MALALGKVEGCPFDAKEIEALKNELFTDLEKHGLDLGRKQGDREDLPIDFRFLGLLLKTAEDPEIGLGDFAQGVRVGPGSRMPRLPALYRPKRRWRLASQTDLRACLDEEDHSAESAWRRNYATVQPKRKRCTMFWMTKLEEECLSDFQNRWRKKGTPTSWLHRLAPTGRTGRTAR